MELEKSMMTQEKINQMFEGRWRIKGFDDYEVRQLSGETVKALCRDFFEAGILLSEGSVSGGISATNPTPHVEVHTSQILPDGTATPWQEADPFDYWWKLYDLKVGKEKCMKKWATLNEQEKAECIAATPAYVRSTPDKKFRKRPLTYLNGKCWNDEIITRNANTQPTIEQQRLNKLIDILNT